MISMSQHIHNLMGESMKGLRDLVDVNCIVGKPIVTASNTTIIPVSYTHLTLPTNSLV